MHHVQSSLREYVLQFYFVWQTIGYWHTRHYKRPLYPFTTFTYSKKSYLVHIHVGHQCFFFFKETKENFQVINRHLRGCSYSIPPFFRDVFQGLYVKGGFFYEFMTQTQLLSHDHTKQESKYRISSIDSEVERDSHKKVNLKVIFFFLWSNVRPLPTFLRYPNFL